MYNVIIVLFDLQVTPPMADLTHAGTVAPVVVGDVGIEVVPVIPTLPTVDDAIGDGHVWDDWDSVRPEFDDIS